MWWWKTAAAGAAFAAFAALGVPGPAAADPAAPTDPTTQAEITPPANVQAPPAPAPVAQGPAPGPAATGPAPGPVEPVPEAPAPAPVTPPAPDASTPAAPAAPKTSIDADGIYAVGTDIAPGVYSSAGPVDNGACYWKRTGPDGAIIDNALTKKAQTVQIAPTDQSFKTSGCQAWQLTDAAVPASQQGMAPALAGVQLKLYMAQLQAKAAASGQPPSP